MDITNHPKTLILTVGLPRSGKSTWCKKQSYPIVCPDAIRLALHGQAFIASAEPIIWATAHLMVNALFNAGHSYVILDACNHTVQRRTEWLSKNYTCEYVYFNDKIDICIKRAEATNQQYLIPVIKRMSKELDFPNDSNWWSIS